MSRRHAEQCAREFRRTLQLDPDEPIDVVRTARAAGAQLLLDAVEDGPQGVFGKRDADTWVFVNTHARTAAHLGRLRFTIAHELGHMALGHGGKVDQVINFGARSGEEADANAFAAELLAPERAVLGLLARRADHRPDVDTLVAIAARFGISCHAAIVRLATLRRVTPAAKQALLNACDDREHLTAARRKQVQQFADLLRVAMTSAPAGDPIRLVPTDVSRRVEELWEHGIFDTAEACVMLGISHDAFERRMHDQGVSQAADDDSSW